MHESFQFAAILITILAGILFGRSDMKELRADFRRMEDRLDGRIDKLDSRIDKLDSRIDKLDTEQKASRAEIRGELQALREDYTEFYAEQRRHDEAIETLKKRQ